MFQLYLLISTKEFIGKLMKYSAFIFLILLPLLVFAQSVDPIYITLNGDITDPDQEVSGLAWYSDTLVLLPQYPKDVIYGIPKSELIEFIDSTRLVIEPITIGWNTNNLEKSIIGFEGFESIAFRNDYVFMTIEAETKNSNCGYLVMGKINKNIIELDPKSLTKIDSPVHLPNMTYESILLTENDIITIYEVNAKNLNENPIYYQIDQQLNHVATYKFPYVNYRLTDATELDQENKFWTVNYFWPGDYNLLEPALNYQIKNRKDIKPVERLLEFEILEDTIVRTETPSLDIELSEYGDSRNWEGIVRLDDKGFLLVTDKFPGTILAFVPYAK